VQALWGLARMAAVPPEAFLWPFYAEALGALLAGRRPRGNRRPTAGQPPANRAARAAATATAGAAGAQGAARAAAGAAVGAAAEGRVVPATRSQPMHPVCVSSLLWAAVVLRLPLPGELVTAALALLQQRMAVRRLRGGDRG
jgi:hypothetical protein